MKVHEAEAILKYYADIPQRIEIIRRQCTALSDEVDPMRGMGTDGMPRGGTPGDSTAAMACRMDELGIGDQLRQLEQQRAVLLGDQRIIQGQMNRLDSGHNLILTEFYISHKKWHEVQQKVPYSVQHLKYLRNVALAQLGRNLERLPECAALLSRALNTREEQRRMPGRRVTFSYRQGYLRNFMCGRFRKIVSDGRRKTNTTIPKIRKKA